MAATTHSDGEQDKTAMAYVRVRKKKSRKRGKVTLLADEECE